MDGDARQIESQRVVSEMHFRCLQGPRHGDVMRTTFTEGQEVRKRAWITMNRFLEFKKRGEKKLPLFEFKEL